MQPHPPAGFGAGDRGGGGGGLRRSLRSGARKEDSPQGFARPRAVPRRGRGSGAGRREVERGAGGRAQAAAEGRPLKSPAAPAPPGARVSMATESPADAARRLVTRDLAGAASPCASCWSSLLELPVLAPFVRVV